MEDAIRGSLVGLALGDALGQPTEGWHPERIAEKWGHIDDFLGEVALSDDTEYTLFSARVLLAHGFSLTREHVAHAWRRDIVPSRGPFKGAGFSEMAAIENLRRGLEPPHSGRHYHSWSDGFAMRVAPFAAVSPGDPETACLLALEDGVVSHAGEGLYGGLAVVAGLSIALVQGSLDDIYGAARAAIPADSWTARALSEAWTLTEGLPSARAAIRPLYDALAVTSYPWMDLAPEAVGLAFGLLRAGQGDFRETVLAAVNLGRDADTVAALVGAMLGARLGFEGLPEPWRREVGEASGRCLPTVRGMSLHTVAADLTRLVGA